MTSNDVFDEARDAGIEGLELPILTPDSGRVERLRTRCRARLVRNQQRLSRNAGITRFARQVLAPALVGGFCVLYIAALVANTLRLYGVFPLMFTRRLRERVRSGRIRCSVRIWMRPHVKVGGRYPMDEGHIVVDSIVPIRLADVTTDLARESGFSSVKDLLGVAKHGRGDKPYLIRFHYLVPGGWDVQRTTDEDRSEGLTGRQRKTMPKPTTIAEYIGAAPKHAQKPLRELYAILKKVAPDATEGVKWGSPVFEDKRILFAFAAFKSHLGFMPTPSAMKPFKKELAAYTTGKASIQLPYDKRLPKTLIRKIAALRVKELREKDVRWM